MDLSQFKNPTMTQRYAVAALATVVALLLRELVSPWFETSYPYFTVWAAVVFSAWNCGVGPAVLTTLASLTGVWYFFIPKVHSFSLENPKTEIPGLVGFAVLSGFIIALGEANRRSHLKRRSAEATLREKASEFHLLADSIPELCWMARGDGHIFWYNARWYEYTGSSPEEMEGWGWQSVHDPGILPSVLEKWRASLAGGESFEMEFPLRGADGVFRWFLTRVRPLHDDDGNAVRWFGTNTNIHQQRELRQSLITAREELELRVIERTAELEKKTALLLETTRLLDLTNDAILVRTADDKIAYWNDGAERLYGWTKMEAIGRSLDELLRTDFSPPLKVIGNRHHWEGELHQTKRDGSHVVVASRWVRLESNDGNPSGWLELNTDITGRKRAEVAARNLSARILSLQDDERRKIDRELHDSLGQYLAALKMSLHLLASDSKYHALASDCSEIVDKCLTETRTISHLLHPPLLDESGLKSALQWYVDGFAQRSGVRANFALPGELARLNRDIETASFRVVQEALTNVHKHSHASEVQIRLAFDADQLELVISDNGIGIPQEKLQAVLESGFGTGVGLAGMKERVRDFGGSLKIQSDPTGTLLRVSIPIAEQAMQDRTLQGVSAA